MPSLFLTGGTGFLGKSLLQRLADGKAFFDEPLRITILSRNPDGFRAAFPPVQILNNVSFVTGDVRDFPFPSGSYDYVIHAAGIVSPEAEREQPERLRAVTLDGTRRVLDFAARCGCRRFLFTSSGAVYGKQSAACEFISEETDSHPETCYGESKLQAEELCIQAGRAHGFAALLPRIFSCVGPHLDGQSHYAVGNFMRDCLMNRPIEIKGDGTPVRSYLYADDLVDGLFQILRSGEPARPYNLGSDMPISIADLARLVRHCAGAHQEIQLARAPEVGLAPIRYVPSIRRIASELGFAVKTPLCAAVTQTLRAYQKGSCGQS
jgi:dTDP-glucose 4,6-dehydratase